MSGKSDNQTEKEKQMTTNKREVIDNLMSLGVSYEHALALRRIAMTLQRWHELECGIGDNWSYSIERDESGKPFYRAQGWAGKQWIDRKTAIADREAGAERRLAVIMANYPALWSYVQGDPRGAALYVGTKEDLRGMPIEQAFFFGKAVYK